jgi:hypothetical protein
MYAQVIVQGTVVASANTYAPGAKSILDEGSTFGAELSIARIKMSFVGVR